MSVDATQVEDGSPPVAQGKLRVRKRKRRGKTTVLTRNDLDRRTKAAMEFDEIFKGVATDLGGQQHCTTIQIGLAEAFAGVAIQLNHLNAMLLLGQNVDVGDYTSIASTMVRISARLGTGRLPRDVTPTINQLAQELADEQQEDGADG